MLLPTQFQELPLDLKYQGLVCFGFFTKNIIPTISNNSPAPIAIIGDSVNPDGLFSSSVIDAVAIIKTKTPQ